MQEPSKLGREPGLKGRELRSLNGLAPPPPSPNNNVIAYFDVVRYYQSRYIQYQASVKACGLLKSVTTQH